MGGAGSAVECGMNQEFNVKVQIVSACEDPREIGGSAEASNQQRTSLEGLQSFKISQHSSLDEVAGNLYLQHFLKVIHINATIRGLIDGHHMSLRPVRKLQ